MTSNPPPNGEDDERRWTILLTGEPGDRWRGVHVTNGLAGPPGHTFPGSPEYYERVDVVPATALAERDREIERLRANADRLAEAVAGFDKAAGPFSYLKHILDAYRSDSPPQGETAVAAFRLLEAALCNEDEARLNGYGGQTDEWVDEAQALVDAEAYRSDSPPRGEAVHPDTERLDFLIDKEESVIDTASGWTVDAVGFFEDPREAIDAARKAAWEE